MESSFVMDDVRLISRFAEAAFWNTKKKGLFSPDMIQAVKRSDLVYCWFASLHSLLPAFLARIYRKPLVVVSGGYDSAKVPEIRYGNSGHWFKKWLTSIILGKADAIIVNSGHSAGDVRRFMPQLENKIHLIYHRINHIRPEPEPKRDPKLVLSVVRMGKMNYTRKKVELIKEVARRLPAYRFIHIGIMEDSVKRRFHRNLPDNFHSLGHIPEDELWSWYYKAHYLLVPSWHEGFGLTAVEALAAGCIPLISGAGAQRESTMGLGVEINGDNPKEWVAAIKNLDVGDAERQRRRGIILDNFTGDFREKKLQNLLITLSSGQYKNK